MKNPIEPNPFPRLTPLSLAVLLCFPPPLPGAGVEAFPPVEARQIELGLGFNVHTTKRWEYVAARDAGAKQVRFQVDWREVEPYDSPGEFSLPQKFRNAFNWCADLGLEPLVVAAYGAPFQREVDLTLKKRIPKGAKVLEFVERVDAVDPFDCHAILRDGGNIHLRSIVEKSRRSFAGALVTSVNKNARSLTLSIGTNRVLEAGQVIRVNRYLYPSCTNQNANNPSVVAFTNFARFIAEELAKKNAGARVEIWNEPAWPHDVWDGRARYYAPGTAPSGYTSPPNYGFARNLRNHRPKNGVRYNWAGTHKSGGFSLLSSNPGFSLSRDQVEKSMSFESFHFYNDQFPEYGSWFPDCVDSAPNAQAAFNNCQLEGVNFDTNLIKAAWFARDHQRRKGYSLGHTVTETGLLTANAGFKARFTLRQMLIYHAMGIQRVNFFRLADEDRWGFIRESSRTKLAPFHAIKRLMDKNRSITSTDPANSSGGVPAVTKWEGTWPLTTVPVVGRPNSGQAKNTVHFYFWQRDYAPAGGKWVDIAGGTGGAPVEIDIPLGFRATSAMVVRTGKILDVVRLAGRKVKVPAFNEPVLLEISPN